LLKQTNDIQTIDCAANWLYGD